MNTRTEPAHQVSLDPNGDQTKRQHIESSPTNAEATRILEYVVARVPHSDHVHITYGPVVAPGGDFDVKTLREAENVPGEGHEGMDGMRPISIS